MKKSLFFFFLLFSFSLIAQRQVQTLNSAWEFTLEKDNKIEIVNIPHTWNSEDAFRDGKEYYRGKGIYTKRVYTPHDWRGRRVFLKFEGSNQVTTLYVNDQKIGEHHGGYTGFVFDISTALRPGEENLLRIEVNNSHNTDIPPLDADFNFYGGIYRDLELIVTNEIHFEQENESAGNILVRTPKVSEKEAQVGVEAKVVNNSQERKNVDVSIDIISPGNQKNETFTKRVQLKPGEISTVNFNFSIEHPELWSPDTPNLYALTANISERSTGVLLDEVDTKFGLRWFEVDTENGFVLNGKPIKLIGANRHQDFMGLGNALPNSLHRKDYEMIKKMGSNVIRTAHYPQDPDVYRICDELGLLVWTEVPVINDVTDTQAYHDLSIKMQREQILQFFNHPSIVMWGLMNEIFIRLVFNNQITAEERDAKIRTSVELAEKLEKETKLLDPNRLSVMALHENDLYNESGIADIPDVIGWNLYFGWYSQGLENFGKFLDDQHIKYPHRPLFISEYGPGADIRLQTDNPKPWDYSEAYQLELHRSYINQVLERDFVFGMTAWNFADFGSSFRQDAAPYVNQKGLVNMDRSKKDIYYYYQARLLEEPLIYISGEHYQKKFPEDENEKIKIAVFSNSENVILETGDQNFSSEVVDGIAGFELRLSKGKHHLIATSGSISHTREIEIISRKGLLQNIDKAPILINVGAHVNYKDPKTEEIWISDQEYYPGGFGYVGGEVYQRDKNKFQGTASDIQGTENDPLYQTMRQGLKAYKFDVPKGIYRVTLLFAEPEFNASVENIYNLSAEQQKEISGLRSFDLKINGIKQSSDMNLARDYGRIRAVEKSYRIKNNNDRINVEFSENSGMSVLSGIRLEKI